MNRKRIFYILLILILGVWSYTNFFKRPRRASKDLVVLVPSGEGNPPMSLDRSYLEDNEEIKNEAEEKSDAIDPPKSTDQNLGSKKKIESQSSLKVFNPRKQIRFALKEDYAVAGEDVLLGQPSKNLVSSLAINYSEEVVLWPNGVVPFVIDSNISVQTREIIFQAVDELARDTHIRFVIHEGQKDFIVFTNQKDLCASYVGKVGGAQPIFINSECKKTQILHEMLHALGFIHEHQRKIRDDYLLVFDNQIKDEKIINFDIMPDAFQKVYDNISNELDFESLMIYPSNSFVKKPSMSSILIKNNLTPIYSNTSLSRGDIEKINNLYFRKL